MSIEVTKCVQYVYKSFRAEADIYSHEINSSLILNPFSASETMNYLLQQLLQCPQLRYLMVQDMAMVPAIVIVTTVMGTYNFFRSYWHSDFIENTAYLIKSIIFITFYNIF